MGKSAFIKLVDGSTVQNINLDEVKELFDQYKERTRKTGEQLDWAYNDVAFPYTLHEKPEAKGQWFYLKGDNPKLYQYILIGVGSRPNGEKEENYIQVTLTDISTAGDKGKANEFCKYLARYLKAELHMFNGRIMYFNPRK